METLFNTISDYVHSQAGYIFSGILFGVLVTTVMLFILKFSKNFTAPARYSAWWLVLITVVVFPLVASVTAYNILTPDTEKHEILPDNKLIAQTDMAKTPAIKTDVEPVAFKAHQKEKTQTFIYRPEPVEAKPVASTIETKIQKNRFAAVWYSFIPVVFLIVWLGIASIMVLRILRAYLNIIKLKRSSATYDISRFKRVEQFISSSALKRKVSVCLSDSIEVPIAAGLGRAVVIIPTKLAEKLSDNELEIIILHELAHLIRWDDWSNLGQKLIGALNFYHPAVHWINKQIDLNREIACDNMVVEHTGNPKKYAECLTRIMQLTVGSGTTLMSNAYTGDKQIFRRFESILLGRDKKEGSKMKFRLASTFIIVSIIAISFIKVSPVIAFPGKHLTYADVNSGISLLMTEFGRDSKPTNEVQMEKTTPDTYILLDKNDSYPKLLEIPVPDVRVFDPEIYERLLSEQSDMEVRLLSDLDADLIVFKAPRRASSEPLFLSVPAPPAIPAPPAPPAYPAPLVVNVPDIRDGIASSYFDETYKSISSALDKAHRQAQKKARKKAQANAKKNAQANEKTNLNQAYALQSSSSSQYISANSAYPSSYTNISNDDNGREYRRRPKRGLFDGLIDWTSDLFSGKYSGTIHSDNDDERTIMWSDGTNVVGMKLYGDITFTDDDRGIAMVDEDGYATIFEKTRRNKVELDIFVDDNGELEFFYLVNRKEKDFDEEAKEWYADIVFEVINKTGVGADQRAERIYKKGGLSAIMDALDEIESSYVKSLYLEHLLVNEKLSKEDYAEIMVYVEREMDSDYEKAELLIEIADVVQDNKDLIDEYIEVVKSLDSDYEIKRVLSEIDYSNNANRDNLIEIMEIIDYMDSDYEKAELLVEIAPACQTDEQLKQAYIEKLHEIDSDYELRRIFTALGRRTEFDKNSLSELLILAESLDSDYEKAEFLYELSDRIDDDPALMLLLINAASTIDSDYETRKVLSNLYGYDYDCVKNENLIRAQLEIVERFDSDYEKTQVLHDLADCVGQNNKLVDDYLMVLSDLSSDYEYKRALIYLIKASDLEKPVVLKILRATEDIDSDYEKGEVLGKLLRVVKKDEDLEDAFIGVLETFSSNSYEADQLYKKLRRSSRRYNEDDEG